MQENKPTKLLQKMFEIRKVRRLTLTDLGKILGVKKSTASAIENGQVPLDARAIPRIAKMLKIKEWELFVDYDAGETGPLSKDEKTLIRDFRTISEPSKRETVLRFMEAIKDTGK